jgi:uncharacterized protein (TIRG00374 family)
VLIGLVVVCISMIILLSRQSLLRRLAGREGGVKGRVLSRVVHRIMEVQENLSRIRSPLTIVGFVAISFLIWLSMSMALWTVTLALGVPVDIRVVPFVCALLNMGISIPSSPGYVGLYQFLLTYLFSIFGVPKSQGLTVSIMFHASWYIPYCIVGFALLLKEHLHIRDIRELKAEEALS